MNDRTIQWFQRRIDALEAQLQVQTRLAGDMMRARDGLKGEVRWLLEYFRDPEFSHTPETHERYENLKREVGL
jgi:hypothetical protein